MPASPKPRLFRLARIAAVAASGAAVGYGYRRSALKSADTDTPRLNTRSFTPYTLIAKEPVSSTASIFTLRYGGKTRQTAEVVLPGAPDRAVGGKEKNQGDVAARGTEHGIEDAGITDGSWGPPGQDRSFDSVLWSVEVKQPDLQISRSYTPLPPTPSSHHAPPFSVLPSSTTEPGSSVPLAAPSSTPDRDVIRLLIRHLPPGEMSPYLNRLPLESEIPLRGPRAEADVHGAETVLFLAAGTGVAPALQTAWWLGRDRETTRGAADTAPQMRLLFASRRREDCTDGTNDRPATAEGWMGWVQKYWATSSSPTAEVQESQHGVLVREITAHRDALRRRGGDMAVEYFVDEEGTQISPELVKARIGELYRGAAHRPVRSSSEQSGRKIIVVSGPEGFVNHWAGPKAWAGGKVTQGPLGGMLSQMSLEGWEVVKL